MERPRFRAALLHPRYWFTWFGFGLWYALVLLPYRLQLFLGAGLGLLFFYIPNGRCRIARRNLELCFPDLKEEQLQALLKDNMRSTGMAFFETGMGWFWPAWRLDRIYTMEGTEQIEQIQAQGQGVILVGFHWTHIDMGGKLLGRSYKVDGSYRPHANPVYDFIQRWGRERLTKKAVAFPRKDVRGMVKTLRNCRVLWYAPDQDYGAAHSIFAPFFGIDAATITATAQLARMGKAKVMPYMQTRLPGAKGYRLKIYPPLEHFPSGDDLKDATAINQFLEARIKEQPEQYLWVHRRFKTRPEGEPSLYKKS